MEMNQKQWDPVYDTGVVAIDHQHRELLKSLGALLLAFAAGETRRRLCKRLSGIVAATVSHFASEERFMQSMDYPGLEQHAQVHADLLVYIGRLQGQLESGEVEFSRGILRFLEDWLDKHLRAEDAAYAHYHQCRPHGVGSRP